MNCTDGGIFGSQEAQCCALKSHAKVDVANNGKKKEEEKNLPKDERTILLTSTRKRRKQHMVLSKNDLEKYIIR